jgi:integrase
MARRRYQRGCLFIRGKKRKMWVARWRESVVQPDGTLGKVLRSEVLGPVSELSKYEARKLLERHLRPINEGRHRPQSTITFAAFVAEHFEPAVLPTLKFSTQQIYSVLLQKHLLPRFGSCRLCDIGRAEVQRFALEKLKQGQSWESANKLRNLLSKVLGTAHSWGYLSENPVRGVKMPERFSVRPSTFLSPDEVRRLLAVLAEPVRTIALLATLVGLGIAEILGLRWGRINLQQGTLRVEETCYKGRFGTPKTRARRRELPLVPTVLKALVAHRSRSLDTSPEALVFATRKGTPLNANNLRNRELKTACRLSGLRPIGWHTLRHTHSSLLHSLGIPLKVAQAQLGHSRLSTTLEIYTHAATEDQRGAVAKLESVLFPNVPKLGTEQETRNEEVQTIQ